ncbi:MAG: tetratricopeptide repeat protein [Acidobacteria bacterium]|nr:tetratricopeptide repeat protein [Acidobacteriota bacterium]
MNGSGRKAALWIAAALAVAAPLPFGSTGPVALALLAAAAAAGLALVALDRSTASPPRWLPPLFLATLALALVYLLPLPPGLVETLSPRLASEARASLAFPGADAALSGAERALLDAAGQARAAWSWRPLATDLDGALDGAARLLAMLAAFAIAFLAPGNRGERGFVAGALGVSAFGQAAYGLAEALSGHQHIFGYAKEHFLRLPSGTFICPNHFAALLSLGLFALLGLLARAPDPAHDGGDRASRHARQTLTATALALVALALLWSSSRAALAAAAIGLVVFAALRLFARDPEQRGISPAAAAALLVLVAALVGGSIWIRPPVPLGEDVERVAMDFEGRAEIWASGVAVARAFPATGSGLGTFATTVPLFRPPAIGARIDHAHCDYVEWWAETGVPGLLLAAGWVVTLGAVGWRLARRGRDRALSAALGAALAALALHEIADFSLQLPGVAVPAALLAGAFLAPARWPPAHAAPVAAAWRPLALLVAAATLLAGTAQIVARRDPGTAPGTSPPRFAGAETLRRWGREQVESIVAAAQRGQAPPAAEAVRRLGPALRALVSAAQRAPLRGEVRITSWIAAHTLAAALPARPAGLDELARFYLRRAEALDPADRTRQLVIARTWLAAGEDGEARRVVRRLLEIDPRQATEAYDLLGGTSLTLTGLMEATPNTTGAARALAIYLRQRGDREGAQIVLERALAKAPQDAELRRLLAGTLADRGRPEEALRVLRAAGAPSDALGRRQALRVEVRALTALGRTAEIDPLLDLLAGAGEDPMQVGLLRARARIAEGDREAAIAVLEPLAANPRADDRARLEALVLLGLQKTATGRYREALDAFREARRIQPDHPEVVRFFSRL